ncbi:MAG TPA: hypothetical protein VG013_17565 [Gemmataceae bacterium]|nr:hypothetical protein [Gemmataceae bacterium]
MRLVFAAYCKVSELLDLIVGAPMALLVRFLSSVWQPTKGTAGGAPGWPRGRPRKGN